MKWLSFLVRMLKITDREVLTVLCSARKVYPLKNKIVLESLVLSKQISDFLNRLFEVFCIVSLHIY